MLEKENDSKLQKTCYMLESQASTCNGLKNAVITESTTQLYFVQSLQAWKAVRWVA